MKRLTFLILGLLLCNNTDAQRVEFALGFGNDVQFMNSKNPFDYAQPLDYSPGDTAKFTYFGTYSWSWGLAASVGYQFENRSRLTLNGEFKVRFLRVRVGESLQDYYDLLNLTASEFTLLYRYPIAFHTTKFISLNGGLNLGSKIIRATVDAEDTEDVRFKGEHLDNWRPWLGAQVGFSLRAKLVELNYAFMHSLYSPEKGDNPFFGSFMRHQITTLFYIRSRHVKSFKLDEDKDRQFLATNKNRKHRTYFSIEQRVKTTYKFGGSYAGPIELNSSNFAYDINLQAKPQVILSPTLSLMRSSKINESIMINYGLGMAWNHIRYDTALYNIPSDDFEDFIHNQLNFTLSVEPEFAIKRFPAYRSSINLYARGSLGYIFEIALDKPPFEWNRLNYLVQPGIKFNYQGYKINVGYGMVLSELYRVPEVSFKGLQYIVIGAEIPIL